ncbi:MAG: adenylate/guanylate cyclase domain-containing protein, partial [Vicinamibacterales bacterium]
MESSPIKRRLAAILAADAVGYSAHMAEDEERTLQTLAGHRKIIDGLIATFDGRIVGTAGDSVLAEFGSSVDAVRCAVEIQQALATRNNTLEQSERLLFRIGINLGDVIVEGADILGDGVNVAARLEGIAEPGGVCVSSSIYDQITGKLNLGFTDMGQQSLKNIGRPVRTYRLERDGASQRAKPPVHPTDASKTASRGPMIVGGAAAVVIVLAAIAYLASVGTRSSAPPLAISDQQVADPSNDEARIKLQTAEAERARAEAELERARLAIAAPPSRAARPTPGPSTEPVPRAVPDSPAAVDAKPAAVAPPGAATLPVSDATATPAVAVRYTGGTAEFHCEGGNEDVPDGRGVVRIVGDQVVVEIGAPGRVG